MKKFVIFLLAVVFILLGIAYIRLFARQAQYQQTVIASTSSVLALNNFDKSRIQIVVGDTDKITVNFRGSAQDIVKLLQSESGDITTLDFTGQSAGLSGTITVPKGMLIDVSLAGEATIDINDAGGSTTVDGKKSFLIDTTNLNSFGVDKNGNIVLDGWGDLIVWDDEEWGLLDGNGDSADGAENTSPDPAYCGIGSQAIRNYCCEIEKKDGVQPPCDGRSYWVFDNITRECAHKCEMPESPENEVPVVEVVETNCGIGSQTARNDCCSLKYVGQYQGCVGSWLYNNSSQVCQFVCFNGLPPDDEVGGGSPTFSYGDSTSDYCATVQVSAEKDVCCNDALKNNLSSGPHPGYPDCIGTWYFDIDLGCQFRCAEHTEMMRILNEIKLNAGD